MPSRCITVRPYTGRLDAATLLAGPVTVELAELGRPLDANLLDPQGDFGSSGIDECRFLGSKIRYIGSGTASAGAEVAGMILPLGPPCDLVVFEAGDHIWFHYPMDIPATADQAAVIIDIADVTIGDPIHPSFHPETRIETPTGPRAIKDLKAGDLVSDVTGRPVRLLWTSARTINLARPMSRSMRKALAPIRIRAGSLGPQCPHADLWVAPGNRVLMSGVATRLLFGLDAAFVPAQSLIGPMADQPHGAGAVTYHHIRCERPCVIVANGVPTQTETDGGVGLRTLAGSTKAGTTTRATERLSDWKGTRRKTKAEHPVLSRMQGRVAAIVAAALT